MRDLKRQIELGKIDEIPTPSGWSLVTRCVSLDGAGLFLFVRENAKGPVQATFKQGIGVFPKSRMDASHDFLLVQVDDANRTDVELPPLDVTFPLLDVFPDGRILVAGTRSRWHAEGDADINGIIIDPNTGECSRVLLGDGIEHLAIDSLGRIWVAYFDEGIYGNFGWGSPGPSPIGSHGLVCFGSDGSAVWEFPFDDEYGPISDCYALNVTAKDVFVYFYTEFPLCRIASDFSREYWQLGLRGCHHMAIDDSRVLFSGQYDDAPNVAYLADFAEGKQPSPEQISLALPDGEVTKNGELCGRGSAFHYFSDDAWYRVDLSEL
jgi:hypothetical protein